MANKVFWFSRLLCWCCKRHRLWGVQLQSLIPCALTPNFAEGCPGLFRVQEEKEAFLGKEMTPKWSPHKPGTCRKIVAEYIWVWHLKDWKMIAVSFGNCSRSLKMWPFRRFCLLQPQAWSIAWSRQISVLCLGSDPSACRSNFTAARKQ